MIIKTLFLAIFMIASALASGGEKIKPFPAALLVQSNFDYSLTRKEFRVHYGGLGDGSANPTEVYIKIYNPDGVEALKYTLEAGEKKNSKAFHFALDEVKDGKYEVEVCADGQCSAKTPSLHKVFTSNSPHMLSCKKKDSDELIKVEFIKPEEDDWAETTFYEEFSGKINKFRPQNDDTEKYQTDYEKLNMDKNPYYKRSEKIFHTAIKQDLTKYEKLFDPKIVDDYCGRTYMLSLHSHIVNEANNKIEHRFKTVNHLSEGGKLLFIRSNNGGKILLETTHRDVVIEDGNYKLLVSLCVTNKDVIESTYCANPITKRFKVEGGDLIDV